MNLLLINTGVFSTILVVLLVVWVVKPKNGKKLNKDMHKIKDTIYGDGKDKVKKLEPTGSIVPLVH